LKIKSKKLRDSARGEECQVGIAGVCSYNTETTILAHLPFDDGGMAIKSSDLSSCYCCAACHDAIDGRVRSDEFIQNKHFYLRRANVRTLILLNDKGIIDIK